MFTNWGTWGLISTTIQLKNKRYDTNSMLEYMISYKTELKNAYTVLNVGGIKEYR